MKEKRLKILRAKAAIARNETIKEVALAAAPNVALAAMHYSQNDVVETTKSSLKAVRSAFNKYENLKHNKDADDLEERKKIRA